MKEYLAKVEENRVEQYNLEDKKNSLSRQLETLLMSLYNDQNEKENAHKSVIGILKRHKLLNKNQELINTSLSVQDKDQYIDKDKDKDKRAEKFQREVCAAGIKQVPMVDPKIIEEFIWKVFIEPIIMHIKYIGLTIASQIIISLFR